MKLILDVVSLKQNMQFFFNLLNVAILLFVIFADFHIDLPL